MLILLLEGLLLVLIVRLADRSWRPMVWRVLFWVAAWSIFWLLLVQLELVVISPDGTYGSDARYYYEAMRSTIEAGKWWPQAGTLTPGYVAFGTFVLNTSPGDSVVWVKLANVGLLLISLVFAFYILHSWGVSKKVANFIIILAGTNGIVTWMAVRNLKDTLFLFLTLAMISGMKFFLSDEHSIATFLRVSGILLIDLVCAWALEMIRPWGMYWASGIIVAVVIELLFKKELKLKISKSLFFGTLALTLALTVWLLTSYQAAIQDFFVLIDFAGRSGGLVGSTVIDIIVAIPRFLIGPGPIRAIFGWEAFQVTTSIGNILIVLGAFMWWLFLPVLILAILKGPYYWLRYSSVLIPLVVFLGVYSFAYSGSVETRFRAIVYILSLIGTAPYIDSAIKQRNAGRFLVYVGIALVVWLGGIATSYISLTG